MSVMFKMVVAPKFVQTLMETSLVDVIVALYWMIIGLLVMVCIQTCAYMTSSIEQRWSYL